MFGSGNSYDSDNCYGGGNSYSHGSTEMYVKPAPVALFPVLTWRL